MKPTQPLREPGCCQTDGRRAAAKNGKAQRAFLSVAAGLDDDVTVLVLHLETCFFFHFYIVEKSCRDACGAAIGCWAVRWRPGPAADGVGWVHVPRAHSRPGRARAVLCMLNLLLLSRRSFSMAGSSYSAFRVGIGREEKRKYFRSILSGSALDHFIARARIITDFRLYLSIFCMMVLDSHVSVVYALQRAVAIRGMCRRHIFRPDFPRRPWNSESSGA